MRSKGHGGEGEAAHLDLSRGCRARVRMDGAEVI